MVFKSDEVVNGGLLIMEDPSRLGLLQSAGQWSCYGLYIACGVVIALPALACPGAKPDGHMVGMVAARGLLRVDQSGRDPFRHTVDKADRPSASGVSR
jgi:hypothetical protein